MLTVLFGVFEFGRNQPSDLRTPDTSPVHSEAEQPGQQGTNPGAADADVFIGKRGELRWLRTRMPRGSKVYGAPAEYVEL